MLTSKRLLQAFVLLLSVATLASCLPASLAGDASLNRAFEAPWTTRMLLTRRDAFTDVRGTSGDVSLSSVGKRPGGAYARSLPVGGSGGRIFTWYSKTPHNEADAESAFIVIHGVNRNAHTYFSVLNKAYTAARDAGGYASAAANSIRVAPLFFSTARDGGAYDSDALAWGDSNRWTAGEASTHPPNSGVSSFAVLDMFLDRFSDRSAYPRMKTITFVAHGGGGQFLQRYAVMGKDKPAPDRLSVRYVVGDPSSMLYFTPDRPVGVDVASCPTWNDYRYGVNGYSANYASLNTGNAASLFRRYAERDVRYVVGLADTSGEEGDQFCMARGLGGTKRRNRSLAYWKYIHLLAGHRADDYQGFPGRFPTLDPKHGDNGQANIPRSRSLSSTAAFRGRKVHHALALIQGAGHSVSQVYASDLGRRALFGSRGEASGGSPPADAIADLDGYTASAN
ncbi:uncharacterized protein PFL1_03703 [Pseudozyma flocculosa PF-1]|uniref:Alpha/beta hydrolase n=2 Tax=Pseudozyma flocculosa TaxID=84751 RepID=A0A5C3F5X8_9BASI|nr:uncharacterized protein PFL1_03703 [Pseudozyma flocculosa PF-1]EPQ28902.1 hypothetical protein PFL1_03703 [Pseudozyma flocculosa PF-1]SPO38611.1 uncharacterized protein PSFLO_04089 [Pseudozyma flocculosa]